MSNGRTSIDNYITPNKQLDVVSFIRNNYKELTRDIPDTDDGNKKIYGMAPSMFPDWSFSNWDEEYFRDYPEDLNYIDTSPQVVNELLDAEDEAYNTGISYIPPKKIKEALDGYKGKKRDIGQELFDYQSTLTEIMKGNLKSNREDVFGELIMKYLPEDWQNDLKITINNRAAGHNYQIRTGEEKYQIDETHEHDPSIFQNLTNHILATGVYDLGTFYLGGKFAKGLSNIPGVKQFTNWASSRTANYVGKVLPNTKSVNKVKDFIGKYYDPKTAGEQIFDLGQNFGFTHAVWAATESAANQRTGKGKYEGGDGLINPTDLIVDSAIGYGEGLALGTAVGFGNNIFDSVYKFSKPRWLKGQRDAKTTAGMIMSNPISKYGSHGVTFATLPLMWDKERRNHYVNEDGNINFGKWAGDVLVGSGMSYFYVGSSVAYGKAGNLRIFNKDNAARLGNKNFITKLSEKERIVLKKKITNMTAGRGKDKGFEEWWKEFTNPKLKRKEGESSKQLLERETKLSQENISLLTGLMRGKRGLPTTLKEKLKSYLGIRPEMPWARYNKGYSEQLPNEINLPKNLLEIRNQVKKDISYEKSKTTNKSLRTEEQNLMNTSMENVSKNLGGKVPYEFFEKDISVSNKSVDMGEGLKTVYEIADKSLKIIDKISIKNNKGETIGVDNSKLNDDDAWFLQAYTPSVIPAYQGYKDTYLNTKEGNDELIRRYEVEENNGNPIAENQKKLLLTVAQNQVDRLDVIREYYNRKSLDGNTESEQMPVAPGDKTPKLGPKYKNIILLDKDGLPMDNVVHRVDKSEANRLIELKRALGVKGAENQGISTNTVESSSQGNNKNLGPLSKLEQKLDNLEKTIVGSEKARDNVNINNKKLEVIKSKLGAEMDELNNTVSVENNILLNKIQNYKNDKGKQIISNARIDGIKDAIDIWALEQLSPKNLDKWISHANRLIKHSGKNSFSEITQEDIKNYFDNRIKEKRKKKQIPAIDDGERSALNNIFKHLSTKKSGAIDENPYTESFYRPYTKKYNEIKDLYKKENPALKTFFNGLDKIKKIAKNIGKGITPKKKVSTQKFINEDKGRLSVAIELISEFPIRDLEINALMPSLIKQYTDTEQWYIDFVTPRSEGGARKTLGVPRPIPITKSMAEKILLLGKEHGMNKELFPEYAKVITKLLQSELGGRITSKAFKSQLKIIAERFSGLSDKAIYTLKDGTSIAVNEITIYNVLAGHAKADDKSIQKTYTNPANFGDFFDMAIPILDKVKQGIESFIKETPTKEIVPVQESGETPITPIGKVIKKGIKKIEETGGGIALGIKDISGKSDKQIADTVSKSKNVPIGNKEFKNKYVKALSNELNRQTEKWTDENRIELVEFYAQRVGIEEFDNLLVYDKSNNLVFNSNADINDLVSISEQLIAGAQNILDSKKQVFKVQKHIDKANRIGDAANISLEDRKEIIKRRFNKSNFLSLTPKEAFEYLKEMKLNHDISNKYEWWKESLLENEFNELVNKIPEIARFSHKTGLSGQAREVFYKLEQKYGLKGLIKIYDDMSNHLSHEVDVQGFLNTFEYKAAMILANDRLRVAIRQPRAKWKAGLKEFNKIKDDIFWLQEDMFKQLTEFVKLYPEHKEIKAIHNKAKKFIDKVYEKEGVLRIDTPESKIAKIWYELTNNIKQSYLDGFKANMTKMEWERFLKKNPIKWIEKTFYVTHAITEEFSNKVGLSSKAFQRLVEKNQREIAYERAFEKLGKNPNAKEVDAEMGPALTEAYNRAAKLKQFTPSKIKAKYLISRKFIAPPVVIVDGKPIIVWDTSYDAIGTQFVAGAAKLSATIRHMPYMLDMNALPKRFKTIPKVIADLEAKGGSVGQYISSQIYLRAGMGKYLKDKELGMLRNLMRQGNHYVSRGHLSWYTSALKNMGIGTGMNVSLWGDQQKDLAVALYRALDWNNRMDAKGRGIIQLSIQALDTGWSASNIIERIFKAGKFASTEEMTRLTASFMAVLEMPKIVDILRNGPKDINYNRAIKKLKTIYELSDEQVFLLKEHGLGKIDASVYNIKDKGLDTPTLKTLGTAIVNFKGKVLTDGFEISQEQIKLDDLHQKIITMAHINTQGATDPLFTPYFIQMPFVKELMLYMQMAMTGNSNISKIFRLNSANGNWWRTILGGGGVLGAWGLSAFLNGTALMALKSLITGLPNPNEIEDKRWKKLLNALIQGEVLHYFSPFLKWAKGEVVEAGDFVGFVTPQVGGEIVSALMDIVKWAIDEAGFKPEGSSQAARAFNYKKFPGQTLDDLTRSLNNYYRNVRVGTINATVPYHKKVKKMLDWEKTYLSKTTNNKVQVLTTNTMSPYNQSFIRLFEETNDYRRMAYALHDKWFAHKGMYMNDGYNESKASELATTEVNRFLKKRDPLSIGTTSDNKKLGLTKNDEFLFFLVERAENQGYKGKASFKFVDELFETQTMYNERIDSVISNFNWILRNVPDFKKEMDKKYLFKIKPPHWDDIGVKYKNGDFISTWSDSTKKAFAKKYGISLK